MKQLSLMFLVFMIQAVSAAAREFLLMSTTDSQNNIRLRYVVELDRFNSTPTWKVGEDIPLDQKKLLSVIHGKYPELTNESIRGIELKMAIENRWFYTVSWVKDQRMERIIVLLDGSIVEPQKEPYNASSPTGFPLTSTNGLYIGDDPRKIRELKRRADEQLRLIAHGLSEPQN